MKTFKFLLFILLFMLIFSFNDEVSANNTFGMLECRYKVEDYSGKINDFYITKSDESSFVSFYYSELEFGHDSIGGSLYLKSSENQFIVDRQVGDKFPKFSKNYDLGDLTGKLKETFVKEINNTGACPNYLLFVPTNVKDKYVPMFSQDSSKYCKNTCPIIGKLDKASSNVKKDTNAYNWEFNYNGKGYCDDLSVRVYVENESKLKASITYPKSSVNYSLNTKGVLETPGVDGSMQMKYIYDLVVNNKVSGYIYWDNNTKQIVLTPDMPSSTCNLGKGNVVENHGCIALESIQSELYKNINDFNSFRGVITDSISKNLKQPHPPYAMIDYSTSNSISNLSGVASNINQTLNTLNSKWGQFDNYYNYLKEISQSICSESKLELDEHIKTFNKDKQALEKDVELLKTTLTTISNRLSALGAKEEAKVVDGYIQNANGIKNKLDSYMTVSMTELSNKIHLNIKYGCDVFSGDMKDWLIQLLDIIKIVGVVLAAILSMVDFLKGVGTGSADTMKKVWKNVGNRLIAVILLFLLPVLIEFILGLVTLNGVDLTNPLCGIK